MRASIDQEIDQEKTTSFIAGELLPIKSDYFWLIVQGVIKTSTPSKQGTPVILGFWGEGDVIGGNLSNLKFYKMVCLTEVTAIAIRNSQTKAIAPKLLYHALQTQQLTYILRNNRIAERLWLLLQWLGNKFGRIIRQGNLIDFKVTHRELAEATGTTRITVTKILNRFERDGLILRPKTRCIILTV